jgi:DNA-directed RNA polymerase subunit RPC12/RpoP
MIRTKPYTYRNHYRCVTCGGNWSDEWYAMCDDDCPYCGTRHLTPLWSETLEKKKEEAKNPLPPHRIRD